MAQESEDQEESLPHAMKWFSGLWEHPLKAACFDRVVGDFCFLSYTDVALINAVFK